MEMKQLPVIAISRLYGSGGREIGARLAEQLGIPFYDKEMIALAARQSGVSESFFERPERDCAPGAFWEISPGVAFEPPLADKVYLAQRAAVRSLVQAGPCVIVGRGAGEALRDSVSMLNVFIYADIAVRTKRALEEYGDSPVKLEERIAEIDRKRAAYFRFYTGLDGRQMENYHLCIDSGYTGIGGAVNVIKAACHPQSFL